MENDMAFQRFTESGKGFKPKISIRPSGTIGISDSALKKFGLNSFEFVALYFDPETKKIAIGGTKEDEVGSQKLNFGRTGATVSAKRFLDYYDLMVSDTKHYECHFDSESDLVILDDEIVKKQKVKEKISEAKN
jgi:hypothetical protein